MHQRSRLAHRVYGRGFGGQRLQCALEKIGCLELGHGSLADVGEHVLRETREDDVGVFILPQMPALLPPLACDEFEGLLPAAPVGLAIVRGVAAARDLRANLVAALARPLERDLGIDADGDVFSTRST